MQRASSLFNTEQKQQIEAAVAEAESRTTSEIVPIVGTVSGRYERPQDMVGLWLAGVAAVLVWLMFPRDDDTLGSWEGSAVYVGLAVMVVSISAAFVIGVLAANRFAWLCRLFTPQDQMREQVLVRARELFFDNRVHHTSGATGLLIYVSLFERRAVILGDKQIMGKLGQEPLDQLCQQLTEGLHEGDFAATIEAVIRNAGEQLAIPFPRTEPGINELENTLVLIDE